MAIILLQLLVHLVLVYEHITSFKDQENRLLFFHGFYMVNPVILKYVTFDFYYFWQSVPGLLLLLMVLDSKKRIGVPYTICACFPCSAIRPNDYWP